MYRGVDVNFVLDSTAFMTGVALEGRLFTTSSILGELKDLRSKARYEVLRASGLVVQDPCEPYTVRVVSAARETGDAPVLSPADIDILALALELLTGALPKSRTEVGRAGSSAPYLLGSVLCPHIRYYNRQGSPGPGLVRNPAEPPLLW